MSNRTRTRLDPEARKAQLLECAMQAFAEQGIERAGHGDVAKIAGVSVPTVFNYFPTREALSDAILAAIGTHVMTLFSVVPESQNSPAEQVREMAEVYARMTTEQPDMAKVFLSWSVSFVPSLRQQYLTFQDVIISEISRRLNSPRPDRSDARIIYSAANMYAMMLLDDTDTDVIDRFVNRVAEAIDA